MIIHRWWGGPDAPPDTKQAVINTHPNATLIDHDDIWVDDGKVAHDDIWRHAANVQRYQWLYNEGGLWLDHDVTPLTDLTTISNRPWTAAWFGGRDGSAMFFPEPYHPMLARLLEAIDNLGPSELSAPEVSGCNLLNSFRAYGVGQERRIWLAPKIGELDAIAIHEWRTARTKKYFMSIRSGII